MSNKLLADVGEALYGPRWQTDLARDLEVSDRTMRRWAAEGGEVPAGVYVDLLRLTTERAARLDELSEMLKRAGAPGSP
jgi:hypothetical protein